MLHRSAARCPLCGGRITIKTNHGCARCRGNPIIGTTCLGCGKKTFYRMSMREFLKEVCSEERTGC